MRINRGKLGKKLEELKKRGDSEKGTEPELVLGCFYHLMIRNDSYCKTCKAYENKCREYLKVFEIKKKIFKDSNRN